jgi:hypothetical protein
MDAEQAIARANQFVRARTGREPIPSAARLTRRAGGAAWSVTYEVGQFFPLDAAHGATIDGPYVIVVDDSTGEASVLG